MKRLLIKVLLLSAVSAVMLMATAAAAEIGTGVIHAEGLRMREAPTTGSAILTHFVDGANVSIQEKLNGWYKVEWNGYSGYVASDYVSFTPAPVEETLREGEAQGTKAVINGSAVNFRAAPSAEAASIGKFERGTSVTVLSEEAGWCAIRYEGQCGYVSADYVSVDGMALLNPRGIVTGTCVNVRSAPTTESKVITSVNVGKLVDLTSMENGWYGVSFDGLKGYISADYVREYTGSTASSIGEEAAALALSYLGTPYVYGGASAKGFDCSGFTMYIFSQFGYSLPHSATSQWNSSGEYVERSDLQPGDIVLFCDPSRSKGKACSHVGIYIGNDEFIHASSSRSGKKVRISSLTEEYYNRYYKGAKRIG